MSKAAPAGLAYTKEHEWARTAGGEVTIGVTAFADTTVAAGKTYSYRVLAVNAAGPSVASTAAAVTTPAVAARHRAAADADKVDPACGRSAVHP